MAALLLLLPISSAIRVALPLSAAPATTQIPITIQDFVLAVVNASSYIGTSVDPISIAKGLTFNEELLIQLASQLGPGQARTQSARSAKS